MRKKNVLLNDTKYDFDDINLNANDKRTWLKKPKIKKAWECPICKQIMKNPVQLNGVQPHTFCRICIESWLQMNNTNPLTNQKN